MTIKFNGAMVNGNWIIPNGYYYGSVSGGNVLGGPVFTANAEPKPVPKLNISEVITNWSKLHDVSFDVNLISEGTFAVVTFNGRQKGVSDSFTKEHATEQLYDLVYG